MGKNIKITSVINHRINKNISYSKYKFIIRNTTQTNKKYLQRYDMLCQNIIINNNIIRRISLKNIVGSEAFGISKYYYMQLIHTSKNSKNLVITNTFETINQTSDIKLKFTAHLFEHEEMTKDEHDVGLSKIDIPYIYYKNNDIITNKNTDKYDNIISRINEFELNLYISHFTLTKTPNYLLVITSALKQLKEGGTLYFFGRIGIINKAWEKIIYLLSNSFENIKIEFEQNTSLYLMICKGFKNNVSKTTLDKLVDICLETRKYNYSVCQVMHYLYHLAKTQPDKQLMYPLDLDAMGISKSYKSNQTTMPIVDDIDINPEKTMPGQYLIFELNRMYQSYFDNVNYNIMKYVSEDTNGSLTIEKEYTDRVLYNKLVSLVNSLDQLKIPYNKTYLAYIGKYNENIMNQIYSFKGQIKFNLVKYPKTSTQIFKHKSLDRISEDVNTYYYNELDDTQELFELAYKVKLNLLEQLGESDPPKKVKAITEDFARGVSKYILQNYKLDHPVSNGFCKLWEILNAFPTIIPNKKELRTFHLAEAPGQFIHATHHYYMTRKSNAEDYQWKANSLNPDHPVNKVKYGKHVFDDKYSFLKRYKERWLWGYDKTGDITTIENLKWYSAFAKKWEKTGRIDLITGDAGVYSDNPIIFQKLEYAQVAMIAGMSSIGGNCVVKHFLPFIRKAPVTAYASGTFMCIIFLYYLMFETVHLFKPVTSSPISGEFYVVGQKFKGLSYKHYSKLLDTIQNYKINQTIFAKEVIPETFSRQIIEFIETILKLNTDYNDMQNMLMTCINDPNPVIIKTTQCNKYLSPSYINEVQQHKFKEWIKVNKFQ
jgi:hypothetical protein